jgi:hypothetical protein
VLVKRRSATADVGCVEACTRALAASAAAAAAVLQVPVLTRAHDAPTRLFGQVVEACAAAPSHAALNPVHRFSWLNMNMLNMTVYR